MPWGWALGAGKTEPQQRPSTEAARGAPVSPARVLRPRGDVAPRPHRARFLLPPSNSGVITSSGWEPSCKLELDDGFPGGGPPSINW